MKILLACNYFQPQFSYAESEIAKALQGLGHEVVVVTGNRYFPFPEFKHTVGAALIHRGVEAGDSQFLGIKIYRKRILFELFARVYFIGLKQHIADFQPNILIVFGISTPLAIQAAWFKKSYHFRLIGVDTHLPSEFESGAQIYKLLKRIFYQMFRLSSAKFLSASFDKVIAAQEGTIKIIKNAYGFNQEPILISHGTNTQLFYYSKEKRLNLRQKFDLQPKQTVILYTGKIIPNKGVELLTKAFGVLAKKNPGLILLLVGAGPKNYLKTCLANIPKEIMSQVILTGHVPTSALAEYYCGADLAVWPLQETLSMLDAAACALPFIVNNQIQAKERLIANNARTYKVGDVTDLAQTISDLISDKKNMVSMGKRGQKLIVSQFSWAQVARRYIA